MENDQYLQYLINEEIYVIKEQQPSAYDAKPPPATTVKEPEGVLPVTGNKTSNIYILNYDEKNQFIDAEQKSLLENILKAINLELDEIALVNLAHTDMGIEGVLKQVKANKALTFGLTSQAAKYTITDVGGCRLLQADDLATIGSDKALKKALWTCLQSLFPA